MPPSEAEQFLASLRERGAAPRFLLLPDEGHEILSTTNRAIFLREVVHWLISHLLEVDERSA